MHASKREEGLKPPDPETDEVVFSSFTGFRNVATGEELRRRTDGRFRGVESITMFARVDPK
jgi:hypothetical protein